MRRPVVFERGVIGGQIATTEVVEKYPGFPDGVNGLDLALAMLCASAPRCAQPRSLRSATMPLFVLTTEAGEARANAVIVTAGAEPNKLRVPGEPELVGKDVSYCATCDAAFFKGVPVAVVGGGDAALDEALFAARFVSTVIHRRDTLRAFAILQQRARNAANIQFLWDTVVERINGDAAFTALTVRNVRAKTVHDLDIAAAFVATGQTTNSGLLDSLVPLDSGRHALVLYPSTWLACPCRSALSLLTLAIEAFPSPTA